VIKMRDKPLPSGMGKLPSVRAGLNHIQKSRGNIMNRYESAPLSQGAVNAVGLANSFARYGREMLLDEGLKMDEVRSDPALRLMAYQICFLFKTQDIEDLDAYEVVARKITEGASPDDKVAAAARRTMGESNPIVTVVAIAENGALLMKEGKGTDEIRNHPAMRLIAHQLGHVMKVRELDDMTVYSKLHESCEVKVNELKVQRKFQGAGHLEATGYIPEGSAAEREGRRHG